MVATATSKTFSSRAGNTAHEVMLTTLKSSLKRHGPCYFSKNVNVIINDTIIFPSIMYI